MQARDGMGGSVAPSQPENMAATAKTKARQSQSRYSSGEKCPMCVCTCVCMHVGIYAKQEQCLNMHTHLSIYLSVYLSIRLTVCLSVRRSCLNDRHGWVPRYACHMMRSGMAR